MTCDNVKTCETCIHHVKDFYDIYVYELKCRRLQTKSCSLLHKDTIIWSGPILSCESERGSFIGSIFMERMANNAKYLAKNPSQTGHPDLIPVKYLNTNEKFNWDQFPYGGVEVKTSSGDLKNGITNSMKIGETRINHITNIVWKGHHTQINNLLGLYWDYYNGLPTLLGAFYSNQLTPDEFTNTIPKIGGGHTTSVCITKKSAREKMMKNWVVIPDMADYKQLFAKFGCECDIRQISLDRYSRRRQI